MIEAESKSADWRLKSMIDPEIVAEIGLFLALLKLPP
jgi:hypothetical protein